MPLLTESADILSSYTVRFKEAVTISQTYGGQTRSRSYSQGSVVSMRGYELNLLPADKIELASGSFWLAPWAGVQGTRDKPGAELRPYRVDEVMIVDGSIVPKVRPDSTWPNPSIDVFGFKP